MFIDNQVVFFSCLGALVLVFSLLSLLFNECNKRKITEKSINQNFKFLSEEYEKKEKERDSLKKELNLLRNQSEKDSLQTRQYYEQQIISIRLHYEKQIAELKEKYRFHFDSMIQTQKSFPSIEKHYPYVDSLNVNASAPPSYDFHS
jgi:hypothetical protein